jgi:hypothetical protein
MSLWINVLKPCRDKAISFTESIDSEEYEREYINQLGICGRSLQEKYVYMKK